MTKEPKNDFQDLERLYEGRSEEEVSYLQHRPDRPLRRLLAIAFGVVVTASLLVWAGFFAFGSWERSRAGGLEVNIETAESVAIGETMSYKLVLKNNGNEVAQDIRLRLQYPDGFIWQKASVSSEGQSHNTWLIPAVSPGAPKEILIEGLMFGEPGSVTTLAATAAYRVPNFRSELQASGSSSTKLETSLVRLEWVAPTQAVPDTTVEYKLNYSYDGAGTIPESWLEVLLPDNFSVIKFTPNSEGDKEARWKVAELTKGSKGEVLIAGRWSKQTNGEQTLNASIRTTDNPSHTIVAAQTKTLVSGGDVVLRLSANESETPSAVSLGSVITWNLQYENTGEHTLADVEMSVRYDGDLIDWSKVSLPDGGQVDNQSVRWSSTTTPVLEQLAPGAKGVLRWTTPLFTTAGSQVTAWSVSATPSFEHHRLDDKAVDQTYGGGTITVPVSSPLNLTVDAFYFDEGGAPVGQGPLPPKVGTATTYRVVWRLAGASHRLRDVVVRATLPEQVKAVANSSSASFGTFTTVDTRHPEWRIDTLEAGLQPTVEFAVTLTPTSGDVGRILVLSGRTTATATDDVTRGAVSAVGSTATTNLDGDAVARGKGVVEP